jgi:hypothetical protein
MIRLGRFLESDARIGFVASPHERIAAFVLASAASARGPCESDLRPLPQLNAPAQATDVLRLPLPPGPIKRRQTPFQWDRSSCHGMVQDKRTARGCGPFRPTQ